MILNSRFPRKSRRNGKAIVPSSSGRLDRIRPFPSRKNEWRGVLILEKSMAENCSSFASVVETCTICHQRIRAAFYSRIDTHFSRFFLNICRRPFFPPRHPFPVSLDIVRVLIWISMSFVAQFWSQLGTDAARTLVSRIRNEGNMDFIIITVLKRFYYYWLVSHRELVMKFLNIFGDVRDGGPKNFNFWGTK